MRFSLWVASAFATITFAAPHYLGPAAPPQDMTILSEYFQLLATKVAAGKLMTAAPVCDLNNAVMPAGESTILSTT